MGVVGCYMLDVYCDDPKRGEFRCTAFPGQFTGQTERECKHQARERGWKFGKADGLEGSGSATCPKHGAPPKETR